MREHVPFILTNNQICSQAVGQLTKSDSPALQCNFNEMT
jgi:hypothetical protein